MANREWTTEHNCSLCNGLIRTKWPVSLGEAYKRQAVHQYCLKLYSLRQKVDALRVTLEELQKNYATATAELDALNKGIADSTEYEILKATRE